jgi:S1-C subfamily serine protease
VTVVALSLVLGAGVIAVVLVFYLRPPPDVALRREMVLVMEQQRAASAAEREKLQQKLDALGAQLAKARGAAGGAAIARANHDAIYLVTVRSSTGEEEGFCTAFAARENRLITNAHCVVAAEDFKKRGGTVWIIQNGHPEVHLAVERMRRIAGFFAGGSSISPDVGWLSTATPLPRAVTLAPAAEYRALATGDPMFTYGFPGRLTDVHAPEATFVEGVIGRVTALDGRSLDVKDARLIQHSAFTSGGTSGSPIFNAEGHVVAVNTGGYAEPSVSEGAGGNTQVVSRSLAGYNFGMRVDLVEQLLSEADE